MGRRTIRAAAAWADGLAGFTLDLDAAAAAELFALARDGLGGRRPAGAPAGHVVLVRLHDDVDVARAQVHRHLRHYMSWLPTGLVDAMAPTTGFAGIRRRPAAIVLDAMAEAGADEVHLVPTSSDRGQLATVAQLVS